MPQWHLGMPSIVWVLWNSGGWGWCTRGEVREAGTAHLLSFVLLMYWFLLLCLQSRQTQSSSRDKRHARAWGCHNSHDVWNTEMPARSLSHTLSAVLIWRGRLLALRWSPSFKNLPSWNEKFTLVLAGMQITDHEPLKNLIKTWQTCQLANATTLEAQF